VERTSTIKKLLVLCEDQAAGRWIEELLGTAYGSLIERSIDANFLDTQEGDSAPNSALILAGALGDRAFLCIEKLRLAFPETRIVILTQEASLETARRALQLGVADYVTSSLRRDLLVSLIAELQEDGCDLEP
jgi:DNA-binding NarL/FixJ family response regulator